MNLIKCELGHIYDAEKFRSCPHCYHTNMTVEDEEDAMGEFQAEQDTQQASEADQQRFYVLHRRRTMGMLVCVAGQMAGEAFVLKEGENVIGRGANMDVALIYEDTISRQQHAMLVWDARQQAFMLQYDESRQDVWINENSVPSGSVVADRDVLRLGTCELILVEAGDIWNNRE